MNQTKVYEETLILRQEAVEFLNKVEDSIKWIREQPLPKPTQAKKIDSIFRYFWESYVMKELMWENPTGFKVAYIHNKNKIAFSTHFPTKKVVFRDEIFNDSYIMSDEYEEKIILSFYSENVNVLDYEENFFLKDETMIQRYLELWKIFSSVLMERYLEFLEILFSKKRKTVLFSNSELAFPISIENIKSKRNVYDITGYEEQKATAFIISDKDYSDFLQLREEYYRFTQKINNFDGITTTPFEHSNLNEIALNMIENHYRSWIEFEYNHLDFLIYFYKQNEVILKLDIPDYTDNTEMIKLSLDISEEDFINHLLKLQESVELYFMMNKPVKLLNKILMRFDDLWSYVKKDSWEPFAVDIFNTLEKELPFDNVFELMGFLTKLNLNQLDEKEFSMGLNTIRNSNNFQSFGKSIENEQILNIQVLKLQYKEVFLSFVFIRKREEKTNFHKFIEDNTFSQQKEFVKKCLSN